jgi:hypothetical protein
MTRAKFAKFEVGELVEMRCAHRRDGCLVTDWLPGIVVATDPRMLGVRFENDVFVGAGQRVPDQTLWCTHGSRNLRRAAERAADIQTEEVISHE